MNRFKVILGSAIGLCGVLAALGASGGAIAQSAPLPGAQVFTAKCAACHSVDRAKGSGMGPNLAGVVGRKAGTLPKFSYSPAMVRSNVVWDVAKLDAFLASPQRAVKGNRMAFAGLPNAKDRSALIAFLQTKK